MATPPERSPSGTNTTSAGSLQTDHLTDKKPAAGGAEEGRNLPMRVMYLHELRAFPDPNIQHMLEECVGKENLIIPKFKSKRIMTWFGICFGVLLLVLIGAVVTAFVNNSMMTGILSLVATLVVSGIVFSLAGRAVTSLMVKQAVTSAEEAFKESKPNVIVASSLGAVVCLQMDIPKLPVLLLSPALDQYYRYMHLKPLASIADYPYVIIVHGSVDSEIPLDDSIRLIETSEVGRCRLEVVDDGHKLSSLTAADFRRWVDEVFERGREAVTKMSQAGVKSVDLSLFQNADVASLS
ncbi:putative transmembrane protein [Toxoplasma gondii TgCatPRC2]|uniref:Transmembrane protein n=14 Tax=Toxoplasma gondii TaxID=5811 RepID=A0A125YVA7_TOXGG|nr:hypothetical protein TGME49_304490 [Toxoplasma gondii ME49]EPR61386.1 hypothetical protein TGGT1_304490 [Toxoplasma gondii GT1]ESS33283.1 putative transmembrane protein [Toxoplasma gondii VEG]KAF4642587.1 hypothetical protein TGRH88_033120 [Toxoplasma gondii]KFG32257.1 putative transmembrane protein [Toxoplasma gondii GAB2-2007-GAL-DOM2]KFG34091.1 putative transmembrane protein [Toxoplasma gondii p89]KFG38416.1 putative transmembrane protein [Toxoplasma gondii FOU]KFG59010.1 putative tran|eukprot:XP_002371884.1 hypothetical protein TGME49_304490 [Toxoplasma gondii ME49]